MAKRVDDHWIDRCEFRSNLNSDRFDKAVFLRRRKIDRVFFLPELKIQWDECLGHSEPHVDNEVNWRDSAVKRSER